MSKTFVLPVLTLTLVISSSQVAQAQNAADTAEARELFIEGMEHLAEDRFASARDRFRRSQELVPTSATIYNLALSLRGTGERVEAVELLTTLLNDDSSSQDLQTSAAQLRDELETEVATVELRACGGRNVTVRVDGERWAEFDDCETLTRRIDPGEHILTIQGDRRIPIERPLVLDLGQTLEMSLTLEELPTGRLVVSVPSDEVRIEVLGIGRGRGGFDRQLPTGPYEVVATWDDERVERENVSIRAGELVELTFGGSAAVWPWILGATVIVLAGAGIAVALALTQDDGADDPFFGVTQTLNGR